MAESDSPDRWGEGHLLNGSDDPKEDMEGFICAIEPVTNDAREIQTLALTLQNNGFRISTGWTDMGVVLNVFMTDQAEGRYAWE